MDATTNETKSPGPTSRSGFYAYVSQYTQEAVDKLVEIMRNSKNESLVLGASKAIIDKTIADVKAVELNGGLNADGEREPIRIFINTGQGFIPATITIPATSAGGITTESSTVQSPDMAPQSPKDIHSDNGSSHAGTP